MRDTFLVLFAIALAPIWVPIFLVLTSITIAVNALAFLSGEP